MRRWMRAGLIVPAATIAAACSDSPTASLTAPVTPPSRPNAAALALTCDIGAMKTLADTYAASPNDPLYGFIQGLFPVQYHGLRQETTEIAFDGLARLAAMRGTSAQKAGATGATFDALTKGFLGCIETYITDGIPANFSVAGALGPGWLFEVRGDDSQDGATTGAYARGSSPSYWAAEPESGRTWGNSLVVHAPTTTAVTNRVLLYGHVLTDYATLDPKVGSAFELATVPTIASGVLDLVPSIHIGLCNVDLNETTRVQHIVTVLPSAGLTCATPPVFALGAPTFSTTNALAMAKKAASFFLPQNAYAAMFVGSVGGAVSELSPSAVINMQGVALNFTLAVADGNKSDPLADPNGGPLKVTLKTVNGSPLISGTVTLEISGNHGKNALFKDGKGGPVTTVTRTTDANGVATFDGVSVTKAGGYRITATGNFDGVDGTPVTSNLFNIKNK